MSRRYLGGLLSTTSPTASSAAASGLWTLQQQFVQVGQTAWPFAGQLLSFVTGGANAVTYGTQSFYVLGGDAPYAGGKYVEFKASAPTSTLTFALSSGGGGGPLDDGDGATASGPGALASIVFTPALFNTYLLGKTLVLALGATWPGYGNSAYTWSPRAYTADGVIDYRAVMGWNTTVGYAQSTYGGYGAVDAVLYIKETGLILLACQGGVASPNFDSGPSYNASAYAASIGAATQTFNAFAYYGRFTHGVPNPSPWSENYGSIKSNSGASLGAPYGGGGAADVGSGSPGVFYMRNQ